MSTFFLGDCYFYKNYIDRAIKEQTKAIQLDSNYYQAYLSRARCYEKLNILKFLTAAEQDYKTALKIKPDAEDIYNTNSELFKQIKQVRK